MKLKLLPDARIDVLEAIESFELLSRGLGDRFEDDLFACFERIKSDHDLFAENSIGFRAIKLTLFQAVVYFQIHSDAVIVFRVCVNGRSSDGINDAENK